MTCQSCVSKVTEALSAIEHIERVEVNLDKKEADLVMASHVSTERLHKALEKTGDYTITEKGNHISQMSMTMSTEEEIYSYKPLAMVLGFILLMVVIHEYNAESWDGLRALRHYMGGFFMAFSFFKLLDIKGFAYNYLSYDIITKQWLAWGFIYPFVELLLGISLLISFQLKWTLIITIIVMGLSSIGVIRAVIDKQKIKCACLGTGFNLPMSTVTIIEDVGMVAMSVLMLLVL